MIQLILSFLFFLLCCFAVFYLPGKWLIRKLQYDSKNPVSNITLSIATGMCFFILGTYILAWVHIQFIYLLFILPFIFLELYQVIKTIKLHFSHKSLLSWESLIILVGSTVMISVTAMAGIEKNGSMYFQGVNGTDGIYNSAVIGNLIFQFPPSFPGLSNTFLQGYHFLYDFMLSQFALLFGFNSFDLYFRFFSLFIAVFYGLSGLTLGNALKMNTLTKRIFLFLLYFSQGIGYFLFYFIPNGSLYNSGIVQPAGNIADPSVILSISLVFLFSATVFITTSKRYMILPILFLGLLPGIKVYAGILVYVAFGVVAGLALLQKKAANLFILLLAGAISAVTYLPFNLGVASLIFSPFLLFSHFMESDMVLAPYKWPLKLQVYEVHNNILRIICLYGIAMIFFFVPSLGIRLMSLVKIRDVFAKKFYTQKNIFWVVFMGLAFLLPVFFIQSIAVFNTIQFYWILWIVLLIPTAYGISGIVGKPTNLKVVILFSILIILSVPILQFLYNAFHSSKLVVSKEQYNIAKYIHSAIPHRDSVLIINRKQGGADGYEDMYIIPIFAALARRPMFYEPQLTEFVKAEKIEESRKNVVDNISWTLLKCPQSANETIKQTMKKNDIQYLLTLDNSSCARELPSLENVKAEGDYVLYMLK